MANFERYALQYEGYIPHRGNVIQFLSGSVEKSLSWVPTVEDAIWYPEDAAKALIVRLNSHKTCYEQYTLVPITGTFRLED